MHEFHGWTAGAAGEDFTFGLKQFNHIECLPILGESNSDPIQVGPAKIRSKAWST
jgi:hypothetical protein